ncbi:AMP-binding protein [Paenibacillus albicereus]|uniref:AMP-binding protein n=1 Tax=Paenibacillus albicereus TaxID=2726185 RepID=A0A6H2H0P5_9BACL|nr:AMP-binding protein [Paenibacillus albicereus]QJC53261.1 AMP-binding protein [Paenibacillus albicereus]
MLTVHQERFDEHAFHARHAEMERLEAYRHPEGKRYAVCVGHAFDLVAIVLYMRERGGSVLLMHESTPLSSAVDAARKADCSCLVHGGWEDTLKLGGAAAHRPSILQYSSGTSRQPALIERGWEQVETEIEHYNRLFRREARLDPVLLVPVSHSYGLIAGTLASMARGEEPAIVPQRNPKAALQAIRSRARPLVYAVPFLFGILDAMASEEDRFHRMVISGSPPSDPLLERMKARADEVWQQYGCTEAGCISVARDPACASDVGHPLAHVEVTLAPEEPGEPSASQGEIVAAIGGIHIRTRDLGAMNPQDGRLHVLGRLDDLINVSGLKVIPSEVESVLLRMPGIKESLVLRTAHRVSGDAVRAMVVAEPAIEAGDVREWCIRHLPAYKVPSVIDMTDGIPRTPAGKISRTSIAEKER